MTALVPRVLDDVVEASVVGSFSRLGPAIRRRLFRWEDAPPGALAGRTAVVTGATSGIGLAIGAELAGLGAQVTLGGPRRRQARRRGGPGAGRPPRRRRHHRAGRPRPPGRRARPRRGASAAGCRSSTCWSTTPARSCTTTSAPSTTSSSPLQVHVVAPFLLTTRLLAPLRRPAAARVLTMSSGGMYTQRLDVEHLQSTAGRLRRHRRLRPGQAGAGRAQRGLGAALPRRSASASTRCTPAGSTRPACTRACPASPGSAPCCAPIPEGADTAVWLAWTPEATAPGGDFWLDRARRGTVHLPWTRTPAGEADRLWERVGGLGRRRPGGGRMKVAIVGTGVSGLVAAHKLHPAHDITVFEADDRIGGPHQHRRRRGRRPRGAGRHRVHRVQRADLPQLPRAPRRAGGGDAAQRDELRGVRPGGGPRVPGHEPRHALRAAVQPAAAVVPPHARRHPPLQPGHAVAGLAPVRDDDLDTTLARPRGPGSLLPGLRRPVPGAVRRVDLVGRPRHLPRLPGDDLRALRAQPRHGRHPAPPAVAHGHRWVPVLRRGPDRPFLDRVRVGEPVHKVVRGTPGVAGVEIATDRGVEAFDHVVLACHSDQALDLLADPSPARARGARRHPLPAQRRHAALRRAVPAAQPPGPGLVELPRARARRRPASRRSPTG